MPPFTLPHRQSFTARIVCLFQWSHTNLQLWKLTLYQNNLLIRQDMLYVNTDVLWWILGFYFDILNPFYLYILRKRNQVVCHGANNWSALPPQRICTSWHIILIFWFHIHQLIYSEKYVKIFLWQDYSDITKRSPIARSLVLKTSPSLHGVTQIPLAPPVLCQPAKRTC